MTKLEAARPLLETSGSGRELARLYTSFGRLFRVHGDPARALTYYERALERQRDLRDLTGEIQTLNAIALALSVLGRDKEAAARYEDALSLARSTGSRAEIGFILQQFGIFHVAYGRYARGAALLEEALTLRPSTLDRARALTSLAKAYTSLGRTVAAAAAADQAVVASRESGDLDARWNAHAVRAEVELGAGRIQSALDDAREGLRLGERLRPNLLPADPFKLGFAERRQHYFDVAISLMMRAGLAEEAFAASEQGRSRPFLDLLASQEVEAKPADRAELKFLTTVADARASADAPRGGRDALGAEPAAAGAASDAERWARATPELKSFVAAEAPSIDALRETAARLTSTAVSYWVTPTAIFAWVLTPDGMVRGRRIPGSATRLRELVQSTWALPSGSPSPIQRGAESGQPRVVIGSRRAVSSIRRTARYTTCS